MDDPTRSLVERASRGDALAVEDLLARNLPALRAYVRLRAGPAVRAHESESDLVQSVCRRVLENLDEFQYGGEAGFRYWLFTTALRVIRNRHAHWQAEKRGGGKPKDDGDSALADAYAQISSPSQRVIAREQLAKIEAAFDRLNERDRELISLARVVGLSHKEIAEKLDCTEGAARVRLLRALARLAAGLDS